MSMQSDGKDPKGRTYDQLTKHGTSSAGTLGAGGTGDNGRTSGTNAQSDTGGNLQKGRTDDLLSNDADRDSEGYVGEEAGELQTGLGGIGSLSTGNAGSRQSDDASGPGGKRQRGRHRSKARAWSGIGGVPAVWCAARATTRRGGVCCPCACVLPVSIRVVRTGCAPYDETCPPIAATTSNVQGLS